MTTDTMTTTVNTRTGRAFLFTLRPISGQPLTSFVAVEASFGLASNSMALVADTGHDLSDVLGLVVAWAAVDLSKSAPTTRYTYALRGSSILAALFNGVLSLVTAGAIGWEAIQRPIHPESIARGSNDTSRMEARDFLWRPSRLTISSAVCCGEGLRSMHP
jgi:Cation efflux family